MDQVTVPYEVGLLEDLRDSREAAAYLNAALEDDDPRIFLLALRHVAEALGMSQVSHGSGLNRENLYRMLSSNGNPQLNSLYTLLRSIGLRLAIQPDQPYNVSAAGAAGVAEGQAEYNTEDENDE